MEKQVTTFITFRLANALYGLPIDCVGEVFRRCNVHSVPGLPEFVRGMLNLRGVIVAAIDISPLLGGSPVENGAAIIIRSRGGDTSDVSGKAYDESSVALIVDGIGDIITDGTWSRHATPANVDGDVAHLFEGVIDHDGRSIVLVDVDCLLELGTNDGGGS